MHFSDSNLKKLNLTICKTNKISLSIPVEITENLDKLNSSSGYFNDICYTASSESGTDITSIRRMENESLNANPELASLFPVVRRLHIDANDFFYPEREKESPDLTKLLHYISTECTNEDARKLLPSIKTLLDMLHSDSMTDIKK